MAKYFFKPYWIRIERINERTKQPEIIECKVEVGSVLKHNNLQKADVLVLGPKEDIQTYLDRGLAQIDRPLLETETKIAGPGNVNSSPASATFGASIGRKIQGEWGDQNKPPLEPGQTVAGGKIDSNPNSA